MAADSEPPAIPLLNPELPLEPVLVQIPVESIAKWTAIPANERVVLTITRADFDNLYFAVQKLAFSHLNLETAFALWTQNDMNGAQQNFDRSKTVLLESLNHLAAMMAGVMTGAQRWPDA